MTTLEEVKKLVEQTHAAARKKDLEMMNSLQKQTTEAQAFATEVLADSKKQDDLLAHLIKYIPTEALHAKNSEDEPFIAPRSCCC